MAVSPVLQIRKIVQHRSSRGVSLGYMIVLLIGFVLWFAYGVSTRQPVHDPAERGRDDRDRRDDGRRAPLPAAIAALAEREPGCTALPARLAASDRRRAHLCRQLRADALGGRLLELGGALDRDAADIRVLEREPAQDARGTRRLLGILERGVAQAVRVEQPRSTGRWARSPATASASVASSSALSSSTGALTSFQVCSSDRLAAALPQPPLHGVEPDEQGPIDSTESQPSVAHGAARRVCHARSAAGELRGLLDRRDPRAAGGSAPCRRRGSRCGRREAARAAFSADSTSSGSACAQTIPVRTPTWPRSTSPKRPARPAICAISHACRSRRSSPSNFCRLGEEERLARQIDPVPEDVGRAADVGLSADEAVDLEAARRERHRAVEDGDPARVPPVQLAREREHGAPAEGDDHRARAEALERDRPPVQSSGALRSKKRISASGTRSGSAAAPRPRRAGGCAGTRRRAAAASRRSRARRRRPTAPRRARAPHPRAAPSRRCSR